MSSGLLRTALLVVAAAAPLPAAAQPLDAPPPEGLWLSATGEAAYLDGDGVLGAAVGVGVELQPFALHLRAPLYLRVLDLPPPVDATAPPVCRAVRCEDLFPGGRILPEALSRVVEHARLFRPGDLLHARAGSLYAVLGRGLHLDGYTNRLEFDRRKSGLYVESTLPFALSAHALAGNLLLPHELVAARVDAAPLSFLRGDGSFGPARLLARPRAALEVIVDAVAPVLPEDVDATGNVAPSARTRPLVASLAEAAWPLFDPGFLQLSPFVAGSLQHGLSVDGGLQAAAGIGAAAGVDVDVDAIFATLFARAALHYDGPAHRFGLFDLAYDVERRRALGGASVAGGSLVRVPAPGGPGARLTVEAALLQHLRAGGKLFVESAPAGSFAEVFVEGAWGPVRAAARAQQRALARIQDLVAWRSTTILLAEGGFAVWGPFSIALRWLRAPRFDPATGSPVVEDDVFLGASFDLVLSPAW